MTGPPFKFESRLDGEGKAAIAAAQELAGEEPATVLHLLRILVRPEVRSAELLRKLALQPDVSPFSASEDAPKLDAVVELALREAAKERRRFVGPKRLLVAAVACATGELKLYLESLHLTPERLRRAILRTPEAAAGDPMPISVGVVAFILLLRGSPVDSAA